MNMEHIEIFWTKFIFMVTKFCKCSHIVFKRFLCSERNNDADDHNNFPRNLQRVLSWRNKAAEQRHYVWCLTAGCTVLSRIMTDRKTFGRKRFWPICNIRNQTFRATLLYSGYYMYHQF